MTSQLSESDNKAISINTSLSLPSSQSSLVDRFSRRAHGFDNTACLIWISLRQTYVPFRSLRRQTHRFSIGTHIESRSETSYSQPRNCRLIAWSCSSFAHFAFFQRLRHTFPITSSSHEAMEAGHTASPKKTLCSQDESVDESRLCNALETRPYCEQLSTESRTEPNT